MKQTDFTKVQSMTADNIGEAQLTTQVYYDN